MITIDAPRPPRRRSIRLRSVMLLILVVGVALGWRIGRARDKERIVRALRDRHVQVRFDWQYDRGKYVYGRRTPEPSVVRRRLGDAYAEDVVAVSYAHTLPQPKKWERVNVEPGREGEAALALDRSLEMIRGLPRLGHVDIMGLQVFDEHLDRIRELPALECVSIDSASNLTDDGLRRLKGMDRLRTLALADSNFTAACLGPIAEIRSLECLDLRGNRLDHPPLERLAGLSRLRFLALGLGFERIDDDSMLGLASVRSLEVLNIESTGVGDDGLSILASMPKLREVWVAGSRVTPAGIDAIRARRPDVRVRTTFCPYLPPFWPYLP